MTLATHLHGWCVIEVAPASRPSRGRWWRENRAGYTNVITEAGLYSKEEASEIERRPEHTARPITDVLAELGKGVVKAERSRSDRAWERTKAAWRKET